MQNMYRKLMTSFASTVTVVAIVSGCAGTQPGSEDLPPGGGTEGERTLTVAYGSDFVFLTPELGKQYWEGLGEALEKKFSNVDVRFTPIAGGYNDITNKLSLLYRSPDTAPDIAEVPAGQMGPFVAAGYLRPLDDYLETDSGEWWNTFPENVKNETKFDGKYYGVNQGQNTTGFWYNKEIFKRAGIPLPWQPKTWDDVLATARQIKGAVPDVSPVWLSGGTAAGTIGIQYNAGNMLAGSSDPTIREEESGKWVVDSAGLRETFQFYKDLGMNGLAAPQAQLLDPNAVVNLPSTLKEQNIAIAVGGNWYGESWAKATCGPCWEEAGQIMGAAPIPTIRGQEPGIASVLGGWEFAVSSSSPNADLAWEFIKIAQEKEHMIFAANHGGWIPPSTTAAADPAYVDFAPPFQSIFAELLPESVPQPQEADFQVWGAGFNQATTLLIQDPAASVDEAITVMKDYITGQLGPDQVVSRNG